MMLVSLFFLTALMYASIGFGGGSTYTALLILTDTDYRLVPVISLVCNIIVVSNGTWRFYKAGHIDLRRILPWIALSVPASFIGGLIPVKEGMFIVILAICLLLSGTKMLFWPVYEPVRISKPSPDRRENFINRYGIPSAVGGVLGFLAGLTGIGGGIFLAPFLHFMRYGSAKETAGACSFFILVNSVSGMIGQMIKRDMIGDIHLSLGQMFLFPAVICGGALGTWLAIRRFDNRVIVRLTALLILFVSIRLLIKAF